MTDISPPKGFTAVYVHEGRVIAHVSDFKPDCPGGFTTPEAQQLRCKMALGLAVVRALSSPLLADHCDPYTAEQLLRRMPGTVHLLPIGYGDNDE
jgi:hypothetical protein